MLGAYIKYRRLNDIKEYGVFKKVHPIEKGWSSSKKFHVETSTGKQYFMRISENWADVEFAKWDFEMQKRLFHEGVDMPEPIAIGRCKEGIFTVFEWVNGEPLYDALQHQRDDELYKVGAKIGYNLRLIHATTPIFPIPKKHLRWRDKLKHAAKYLRRQGMVKKLVQLLKSLMNHSRIHNNPIPELSIPGIDNMKTFISKYSHEVKPTKAVLLHGDVGLPNVMILDNALKIVDFTFSLSAGPLGDPLHEFALTIAKLLSCNVYLLVGFTQSYLNNIDMSTSDWTKITYYTAKYLDRHIYRQSLFMRMWLNRMANFFHFNNDMHDVVPRFYIRKGEPQDDIERFKYHSCRSIEEFWMHFEQCDNGNFQLLPCRRYKEEPCAMHYSEHSIKAIKEYSLLLSRILEENIRVSKYAKEGIFKERFFTKQCADCPCYQEKDWTSLYHVQCISFGVLYADGYDNALGIVELLQRTALISSAVRLHMTYSGPESQTFTEKLTELLNGKRITWESIGDYIYC